MANRKAIICGVGPGNGMAIARRFAGAGYDLALLARDKTKLKTYADELKAAGRKVKIAPADFASVDNAEKGVRKAIAALGGADVLIYNASIYRAANWRDYKAADLMDEIAVGAGSAYAAFRAAGLEMRRTGGGAIIATGGGSALHPDALGDAPGLAVAKGALRNLVIAMHGQFADDGVLLSTVTIDGNVKAGTFFDPDRIAEKIFKTAHLPRAQWTAEILYREETKTGAT